MSPIKSVVFVLATTGLFGLLGAVVGVVLGTLLPDYYIGVFGLKGESPIAVGFGLGLTQGFILGVIVGVVVLVLQIWQSRKP